ncbi:MAG: hypothetical protein ABGY75_18660 [Gemmataceae bacterium]
MSEAAATLLEAVLELSVAERLAIADAVYASLPTPPGLSEDGPEFEAIIARRSKS